MAKKAFLLSASSLLLISVGLQQVLSDEVPIDDKYDVKELHVKTLNQHRFRRDVQPIAFEVDGKTFKFNLVPSERQVFSSNIPVWRVKSNPGHSPNYTYKSVPQDEIEIDGTIYVDNEKDAVFLARYSQQKQKMLYDGVFGEGKTRHIVRSITGNLRNKLRGGRKFNSDHIIYRAAVTDDMKELLSMTSPARFLERNNVELEKRDKPLDTLYPKILAVVDYHLFKQLGLNVREAVKYMAIFWNGVDQKYSILQSPKVQIILTGIIIAEDEAALPYIYKNRNVTENGPRLLDAVGMLNDFKPYLFGEFYEDTQFSNYDAAMVLTPLSLATVDDGVRIAGLASSIGRICDRGFNGAISIDNGNFGTILAVHELGHLLNLWHDQYNTPCSLREYNEQTKEDEISVMSFYSTEHKYYWSTCSKEALSRMATYKASECLRNREREED